MNLEKVNVDYSVKSNGFESRVTVYRNGKLKINAYNYQFTGASSPIFETDISKIKIKKFIKHLEDILKIRI